METYNSEEEQIEALKKWWKANGQAVITGVVAGVILIAGWNFWTSYQQDKMQQASSMYDQLLVAVQQKKNESVTKLAEQIETKFNSTPYSFYAELFEAKAKVQAKDLDGAKQVLENIVAASSGELQHVARIRLIRLMMAQGEYEQGLQLISEVDPSSANAFIGNYEELKGDLYAAMDRPGEARTAYQNALREGHTSPLLQFKMDDLTPSELVENKS